jgi:putative phosphoesterase
VKFAIVSDIHANLHALEAVWTDLEAQSAEAVYCLGDLVGYGAYPDEVIDFVRARGVPVLMGNYDDGVGFDRDDCGCVYKDPADHARGQESLRWTRARVSAERKAYLRGLPFSLRLDAAGQRLRLVHGSPRRINEYLYQDRPASVFANVARVADCDVLFFGHTHLPYQKRVGDTLFVNAGSVGKPKDGDPRAGYLIVTAGAQVEATPRRVGYDVAAAARAVRLAGLPAYFAALLETGGRPPEAAPAVSAAG